MVWQDEWVTACWCIEPPTLTQSEIYFLFSWSYQHFSFLLWDSFRHTSFHLAFTIIKLRQVPGFMLLLKKSKRIQAGWWRDETSSLKYFKQKLRRFHQSRSAQSFIISVHCIINRTLVAKMDAWPPRKRCPDFKCGREEAVTNAQRDCSITNLCLIWIQEQRIAMQKRQSCQILFPQDEKNAFMTGDINHHKKQLKRWNANLRAFSASKKCYSWCSTVVFVEDGWFFCSISFVVVYLAMNPYCVYYLRTQCIWSFRPLICLWKNFQLFINIYHFHWPSFPTPQKLTPGLNKTLLFVKTMPHNNKLTPQIDFFMLISLHNIDLWSIFMKSIFIAPTLTAMVSTSTY